MCLVLETYALFTQAYNEHVELQNAENEPQSLVAMLKWTSTIKAYRWMGTAMCPASTDTCSLQQHEIGP